MGTINQPKPSSPGSPQPDQQPLQPGGPQESRTNAARPDRPNVRTPERSEEEIHGRRT
jgi:hypothetical protein